MPRAKAKPKGADRIEMVSQQLESLVIEWADPAVFKPNPWNPNRQNDHEFHMLCMSMEDAGFTQPVMVVEVRSEQADEWDKELASGDYALGDIVIVDGEHRWRAAQALGIAPIPYVVMPYGAAQARLSTLQMNRARGSEDINLATEVLRDLEKLGVLEWAGSRLDMSDAELGRLLTDIPEPDALPGDRRTVTDESGAVVSVSPEAARSDREYQERVREAKTQEERAAVASELSTFRLVLSFAGDEADVVRQVLGADPTATVLRWVTEKAHAPVTQAH